MKEIVQSIKPKWVDLIFKGVKTIELRKSRPANIEYPFKVYIYETKLGAGAIVGEYMCNGITTSNLSLLVGLGSCVSANELMEYMGNGKISAWSITNVIKYKKHKPLSDFGIARAPQSWCYIHCK
ncbi:MAG TPA: hypothetical protein VMV86_03380 [Methanosarcinales archaeon]|nr:hypothetical protein [Methanosarcinales archaeon]